jgi:formylglycine-generating enzyme required for sulfatase activity
MMTHALVTLVALLLGASACNALVGVSDVTFADATTDSTVPSDSGKARDGGADGRKDVTSASSSSSRSSVSSTSSSSATVSSSSTSSASLASSSGSRPDAASDAKTIDAGPPCDVGGKIYEAGTTCAVGEVCFAGQCRVGCFIDGAFYSSDLNPGNGCQICQPLESTSAWSNTPASCNGGAGTCIGGSCQMPPSCATAGPGKTDCGPDGGESCCTSLEVPAGSYARTYQSTLPDGGATDEFDPATVSGLRLDKYLVTVARFRGFVKTVYPTGDSYPDGGLAWKPAQGSGKHAHLNQGQGLAAGPNVDGGQTYEPGWIATDDSNIDPRNLNLLCDSDDAGVSATWTAGAGENEKLPIDCVNWWEAYAFCIWDGGFLPSEAEWEHAAVGGSEQWEYPWGSAPPGTDNQYAIFGCNFPTTEPCLGVANVAPVGSAPAGAGLWGQLDMAGEVNEWNLDWFASNYPNPCTDCTELTDTSDARSFRGGNYNVSSTFIVPTFEGFNSPSFRGSGVGFRCARVP